MKTLDRRTLNWILILLIAVAAIVFRVYAIDRLPPGLFGDEAVEGLDALDVMAGNLGIWFHAHLGREPIYVYLVALSYQLFGVTPLATRLPSIIAGLLTVFVTFFFVREWATSARNQVSDRYANRLALLTTMLIAISFWHIQMTRDAHRDTLLPLVEAIGYFFLWRGIRTRDWKMYAIAGAVLGLAIYTYSPGRFVGVFVATFVFVELVIYRLTADHRLPSAGILDSIIDGRRTVVALAVAASTAIIIMLPLGIYFVQNPGQFSRRFESVSILDQASPTDAFTSSVSGNLAQFVVPGAGYQSKHYNLPGKPVFDLLIAPWFLAGIVIALTRWRQSPYRFLLFWFGIMLVPAFLTADMIPKGVRVLGVVPGVFIFPALAMEELFNRFRNSQFAIRALIILCIVGSAIWTAYDYFFAWANLPELPLAFDADQVEVAYFIQKQPPDRPIYISQETYRPPTLMLLGEHVPTSRYVDRGTRIREFDARTTLVVGAHDQDATYVFMPDHESPVDWLAVIAPQAQSTFFGNYLTVYRMGTLAAPQRPLEVSFNPLLKLVGVSRYVGLPQGVVLYWQVVQLPTDRTDLKLALDVLDLAGTPINQDVHTLEFSALDWKLGDLIVDWHTLDSMANAPQFRIQITRGNAVWLSAILPLR